MKSPKVTIITATYNAELQLERTINSILEQDYPNIEYIIIDGGSSDRTVEIVKKYQDSLAYWVSERDSGIYNAWNKGVLASSGELIAFLSADDWFAKSDVVSNVVKQYKEVGSNFVYSAGMIICDSDGQEILVKKSSYTELINRMSINHPTSFISNKLLQERNFCEDYKISGDYDLFLYLYKRADVNFVCDDRVTVYMSEGGVSDRIGSLWNVIKEDCRARKTNIGLTSAMLFFFRDVLIKVPKKVIKHCLRKWFGFKVIKRLYNAKAD
jgi:glycosyltransferase involved in cell wall biosynthesis